MPSPRKFILSAVVASCFPACQTGPTQTCLTISISYAGTRSGTAYLRVVDDETGRNFSMVGSYPSIQDLMHMNGASACFGGGEPIDIPFTSAAWIDVSGSEAANCSNVLSSLCEPSPNDPQAHRRALLRYGELTKIRLDLVDPL